MACEILGNIYLLFKFSFKKMHLKCDLRKGIYLFSASMS